MACREGHEAGGTFALAASLLWALAGSEGGVMFVLLLPAAAVTAGFFCSAYFTPNLLPTLTGCLLALALCEGGVYIQRALLGYLLGFSLIPAPVLWLAVRGIGKAGGR